MTCINIHMVMNYVAVDFRCLFSFNLHMLYYKAKSEFNLQNGNGNFAIIQLGKVIYEVYNNNIPVMSAL